VTDAIVLDTDIVVDILRGRDDVLRRLAARSPDAVGVTTMTVAELRYGALVSRDSVRNMAEVDRFLAQVRVLSFGRRSAAIHAQLRQALRPNPVGPNDLVIAATTLAFGAALATANQREFSRVPGLTVEDWREQ
jgi:tRNA(fMet)-specific endonuclease VapC